MAWIDRCKGRWRVRWREEGDLHTKYVRTQAIARDLRTEVERQIALRGFVRIDPPPACPRLHVALDAWAQARRAKLRPRTVASYEDSGVHLLRFLACWRSPEDEAGPDPEAVLLSAMQGTVLVELYSWLVAGGRTRTTAMKRAQAAMLFWRWARQREEWRTWVAEPPGELDIRRDPTPAARAPSWDEADACLAAIAPGSWLHRFALIARFTGLRRSEILQLRWEDLDLDHGALSIRAEITKGGTGGRVIPLSRHLLTVLASEAVREGYLVAAPELERQAAEGAGRGHVDRDMKRAWTRAEVPADRWRGQPCHAFRKTIETELLAAGQPWSAIEMYVGHALPGTGRVYLDPTGLWRQLTYLVAEIPPVKSEILHGSYEADSEEARSASKDASSVGWRRAMGIGGQVVQLPDPRGNVTSSRILLRAGRRNRGA